MMDYSQPTSLKVGDRVIRKADRNKTRRDVGTIVKVETVSTWGREANCRYIPPRTEVRCRVRWDGSGWRRFNGGGVITTTVLAARLEEAR